MTLCCPLALSNCRLTSISHVLSPLCGPFNVFFVASRRSLSSPRHLLKLIFLSPFDCHLSPFTTFLPSIYRPCVTHWASPSPFTASSSPLKPAMRFRIPLGAGGFSEKYHVSPLSILWYCFDGVFNAPKWLQDCMLSLTLRWHTNEQVQWPGGDM